jgi:ligand-binding sensor domain-containing protein
MKASNLFLILFLSAFCINAQSIGSWRVYSNLKDVRGTIVAGNDIWAATSGGVFKTGTVDSTITPFSKADGFASQFYESIANDVSGKIWFGSKEGFLNIYDPQTRSIDLIVDFYNTNKTKKMINSLSVSGDTIFASLDFGLSIISASKKNLMDSFLKFGNLSAETKVISAFKSNLIFVCTASGIAIQKPGATNLAAPESWNSFTFTSQLPFNSATKFVSFGSTTLVGTSNGVYQFQNNIWSLFTLKDSSIVDIFSSSSILYIVTKSQLYQYSNNQISKLYENKNRLFSSVYSTNQAVYISSDKGIFEYKNGKVRTIAPNSPNGNSFVNMSVDPKGSLWVATGKDVNGKGFFEYDGETWKIYNKELYPSIPTNAYYSVNAASDSAIYLGNWGSGSTILKNNAFTFYNTTNSGMVGVPENVDFLVITDTKLDSKGNVWLLNYRSNVNMPISVLTANKNWYHYSFSNPVVSINERFDKMIIDQYDTKWFCGVEGNRGIYYYNENGTLGSTGDDSQGMISTSDGLSSDLINCLALDRRGQIWIGTNVGIDMIADPTRPKNSLFTSASLTAFGRALRNQMVNCIAVDPIDQKWIGTTNGVFVLSSDGYSLVNFYDTKNCPLPDNNILSIAIDSKNGKVYFGTDYGLAELKTEFIEPRESFEKIFTYPNPFIIGNGETVFVTIDGLVRNSIIKILGISGDLIREIKSPGGRVASWDGKDEKGNFVSSGVYILVAYDQDATNVATAKIAVIRK